MNNKIMLLDGSMSYPLEKLGYNLNKKLWTGDALINNPDIIKNQLESCLLNDEELLDWKDGKFQKNDNWPVPTS